jgi:phospholipid-binding lipoprotein MlaA
MQKVISVNVVKPMIPVIKSKFNTKLERRIKEIVKRHEESKSFFKKELDMKAHKEDFGQTLGFYGVGDGFHIVLPFLGPSNLRDIVGLSADIALSPTSQLAHNTIPYKIPQNDLQELGIDILYKTNEYSFHPDFYEKIKADAIDLYPYLRDMYNQKREKEIQE